MIDYYEKQGKEVYRSLGSAEEHSRFVFIIVRNGIESRWMNQFVPVSFFLRIPDKMGLPLWYPGLPLLLMTSEALSVDQ